MKQPDETKKPETSEVEAPKPGETLPDEALEGAAGGRFRPLKPET